MMIDRKKAIYLYWFFLNNVRTCNHKDQFYPPQFYFLKDVLSTSMLECCHLEEKTLRYAFHCLQSQAEYDKKNYKFLYFFL